MTSLADALPKEIARVREVLKYYEEVGPAAAFAVHMIKRDLLAAETSIGENDTVGMLKAYASLKEVNE